MNARLSTVLAVCLITPIILRVFWGLQSQCSFQSLVSANPEEGFELA